MDGTNPRELLAKRRKVINEARRQSEKQRKEQFNRAQRKRAAEAREHTERWTPRVLFRDDGTYLNEGMVRRRCVNGTWRLLKQVIPWKNIGGIKYCEARSLVETFNGASNISIQLVGKLGIGVIESPDDLHESHSSPARAGMDISSRADWERTFASAVRRRRRMHGISDAPLAEQPAREAALGWVCEGGHPAGKPVESLQDAMPFEFMADLGDSGILVYVRRLRTDEAKGQPE